MDTQSADFVSMDTTAIRLVCDQQHDVGNLTTLQHTVNVMHIFQSYCYFLYGNDIDCSFGWVNELW